MSGCRIGKVTLKGGARLSVFRPRERDAMTDSLLEFARVVANHHLGPANAGDPLKSFVVVGLGADGTFTYCSKTEANFLNRKILAGVYAEIIRARLSTEDEVADFCVRHGWLRDE